MSDELLGNWMTRTVSKVLAGAGALNWGLVEFADTDVLVDTLGLSGDVYAGVIAAVAIGGAIVFYNASQLLLDNTGD